MIETRISVDSSKLSESLRRIQERTGRGMSEIVEQAGVIFARNAGKEMPPFGKWAHPGPARKRTVYELSLDRYFNQEHGRPGDILGNRKRTSTVLYAAKFGAKKSAKDKRPRKVAWQKGIMNKMRIIKTRGIAKQQFWRALELQGISAPRGAYTGPIAKSKAAGLVEVIRRVGPNVSLPFVDIRSRVETASRYRPIAVDKAMKTTGRQVAAWARRLEKKIEQEAAK